jgi:hypothetical protein
MTHGVLHISAIALGMATFVSISPLSAASADSSAPSGAASATSGATSAPDGTAPTPSVASSPSGSAPTPTAGSWPTPPQRPSQTYVRHYARYDYTHHPHYAWRSGHRYRVDRNPVVAATSGVVGGMADLGSLAAYPIYCFPRYSSCPVYLPYP